MALISIKKTIVDNKSKLKKDSAIISQAKTIAVIEKNRTITVSCLLFIYVFDKKKKVSKLL